MVIIDIEIQTVCSASHHKVLWFNWFKFLFSEQKIMGSKPSGALLLNLLCSFTEKDSQGEMGNVLLL